MMKKFLERAGIILIPIAATVLIKLVELTMRVRTINIEGYREHADSGKGFILAFWHARLLMIPAICKEYDTTALISLHRDGELIARTVSPLGVKSVRGSSTRGWFGGIKGLLKRAKDGSSILITPDGPKGPARIAQSGIIQIAQKTGLPIIPVSFNSSKKKLFKAGITSSFPAFSLGASTYSAISSV